MSTRLCSIDGCDNTHFGLGWCLKHYHRNRRNGDPLLTKTDMPTKEERLARSKVCAIDNCEKEMTEFPYCGMHATRLRRTGDVGEAEQRVERGKPKWAIGTDGYVRIAMRVDGKHRTFLQHRVVMEEKIGRALLPHENVHHINGVKHDNRPENLELWSKSQPAGQRVEDKIRWAQEILETYKDLI